MKKYKIIFKSLNIIMLTIILVLLIIILFFLKDYINKETNYNWFYTPKTACLNDSKEVKIDEDYAKSVAAIVYKQLYGEEYSSEDFIIKEPSIYGTANWQVYLDPESLSIDVFNRIDRPMHGLLIDKNNGAVVANLGDEYMQ